MSDATSSWEWARDLGFDLKKLAEAPFREQMIAATMSRVGCTRERAERIVDRVADRIVE